MHVLHLIKTSEGATWAINLIKELKFRYTDLTFSVIIPNGGKHVHKYYEICRNVYLFDYNLNYNLINQGVKFRRIVIKDEPDIIHSWFSQTTLYSRFFLRNIKTPRLFQVVGPLHLENSIFKYFDIKSAQSNDYWVGTSKYILNKYRESKIIEKKLFLNYAYIDTDKLLESKDDIALLDFRKEHKIPERFKIIGTASYIYPPKFYNKTGVKGHEQLLEVFAELLKVRDDVVLVIAGTTFGDNQSYLKSLELKASKISKEKIFFTGKYSNIYNVISIFDVFVYLSRSENLGGVFESLLFEVPTVSSDRGALPELVINNETGFNVPLNNNKLIVSKILELLSSDNESIKVKGKLKVQQLFDKNKIIEKAYLIYKEIV